MLSVIYAGCRNQAHYAECRGAVGIGKLKLINLINIIEMACRRVRTEISFPRIEFVQKQKTFFGNFVPTFWTQSFVISSFLQQEEARNGEKYILTKKKT